MKRELKLGIIILLFLGSWNILQAQKTITTTGGEASGSGGTTSYTVGQVAYTTNVGTKGYSVAQGVQQAYEISVVTSLPKAKDISLSVVAYPNPTTTYLTVETKNYETTNLQFFVFDINGKLLQKKKATSTQTNIDMQNYSAGNYFVKVLDKQTEIKVFRIIKK